MPPTLLGIPSTVVAIAAASVTGTLVSARLGRRLGVPGRRVAAAQALLAIAAIAGAKGWSVLERAAFPALADELGSGFRYPGGLLAALAILPVARTILPARIGVRDLGDLAAPGIGIGMAVMRLNCFVVGCCTGRVCSLPWCLPFPAHSAVWTYQVSRTLIEADAVHSLPVHPLQLYDLAAALVAAAIAARRLRTRRFPGEALLVFLLLHEGTRAALEWLRDPPIPALQGVTAAVAAAAALVLLAAAVARTGSPTAQGSNVSVGLK